VGLVISPPVSAPAIVSAMPNRSAQPSDLSANRVRQSATATAIVESVWATIAAPITPKAMPSAGVLTLKWLVVPRQAWVPMIPISSTIVRAVAQPMTRRVLGQAGRKVKIHARVSV